MKQLQNKIDNTVKDLKEYWNLDLEDVEEFGFLVLINDLTYLMNLKKQRYELKKNNQKTLNEVLQND